MRSNLALLAVVAVLAVLATGCPPGAGTASPAPSPTAGTATVGAGPETESRLLAGVVVELLEHAGIPGEVLTFEEARDARQALELGRIDLLPGYTGAIWLEVLSRPDPPGDPRSSFRRVSQLDAERGISWMRPTFSREERTWLPPANATFAFVVQGPPSVDASLQTMTELASRLAEEPDARLCVDPEFAERPDGLEAVLRAYGIRLDIRPIAAPPEDAVNGILSGACVAGLTTATDGRAWQAGLRPLRDDLHVFPAFVVSVQHPLALRQQRPEIIGATRPLPDHLTTELLGSWNARVAAGEPVEAVVGEAAEELLRRAQPPADPAEPGEPEDEE